MTTAFLMFAILAVLLVLEVPVAAALGLATVLGALHLGESLGFIPIGICGALDKWELLAIPFFIIAGLVLGRSGISRRLVKLAAVIVGEIPGGLAIVTIVVSIFFAGISGSGPADVAALGLILIPAMVSAGYKRGFASALMAACGGIGIIVPPSIALILYGVVAGQGVSIKKLFMAGVLPGFLVGGVLIGYCLWRYRGDASVKSSKRGSPREVWKCSTGTDAVAGVPQNGHFGRALLS